jgi:hypothetical protein
VKLEAGGEVSNASQGLIAGYYGGVAIYHDAGSVSNQGTILSNLSGVYLSAGGSVSNASGGTIAVTSATTYAGVGIYGASGSVTNCGMITGGYRAGVELSEGGAVTNLYGGTISGVHSGIYLMNGGSVTNQSGAAIVALGTSAVFSLKGGGIGSGNGRQPGRDRRQCHVRWLLAGVCWHRGPEQRGERHQSIRRNDFGWLFWREPERRRDGRQPGW